jgi:periplasmic divalent cation tolerance protein
MYRIVLVTAPDLAVARQLARGILENRLAACVNLVPGVESHYWWEGELCREGEVLMVLKSVKARLAALEEFVLAEHPYDTPEFVVLSIESGSRRYLEWIGASVEGDGE